MKILLDDVALVAETYDEIVYAVRRVDFHDVPNDRFAADLDHGFRFGDGFFGEAGSESSGKYDCFHVYLLSLNDGSLLDGCEIRVTALLAVTHFALRRGRKFDGFAADVVNERMQWLFVD
jgi:hypothetical protein